MTRPVLWIAQLLVISSLCQADVSEWKQVKDLKGAMYEEMKYSRACVKLLNNVGPQGCEAANEELIVGPIVHKKDLNTVPKGRHVVVVPAPEADSFLAQLLADADFRSQVAGVLIDPTKGRPPTQSVAPRFPGAAYAPYTAPDYPWNPAGTSFSQAWFGIPIYYLTTGLAEEAAWRAQYNADNELKGGRHVARLELPMQAQGDSGRCITEQTCLPVGSHAVWSAVPALPDPLYQDPASKRPITLVLAQMDSNGLIHDQSRAAGSAVSGLIASMVALTILVNANFTSTYGRQLAFVALPGEAFDYTGSRRLLYEMYLNSSYVRGLQLDLIDQVVEVGQVGDAWDKAANQSTFYLHTQRTAPFGNASALVEAALVAGAAEAPQVRVQAASAATPGIPPSSLMAFLRVKPQLAGMVLADFDTSFRNPYFQSVFDDGSNITVESMVDAAVLVARTLHSLAAGNATPAELPVNRTTVRTLVVAFSRCLILDSPGMRCNLAASLMSPDIEVFYDGTTSAAITGYPGVLSWFSGDPKQSSNKPNLPRFIFNYLGNLTFIPPPDSSGDSGSTSWDGAPCDPTYSRCPYPLSCIGWRYGTKDPAGMGRCRNTTTNYMPVYSTRMVYSQRRWWISNASLAWEQSVSLPPDAMWTESNWPAETPTLTVYQQESETTQIVTLVVGLVLTAATGLVSWLGVKAFERHLKTQ